MAEFFMGRVLTQRELPVNSPRPRMTPPDGVIMTDVAADGSSRRFLYKASLGGSPEEITISQKPGRGMIQVAPMPTQGGPTAFMTGEVSVPTQEAPLLGQVVLKAIAEKKLGQTNPVPVVQTPAPAPAAPGTPPVQTPSELPVGTKCPGALQMPDGRIIQPGDPITLEDVCEIVPFLIEAEFAAMKAKQGLKAGQNVPIVGQPESGLSSVGAGMSPFGNGAGGGFIGGGGTGARGIQGPPGPPGAAGAGTIDPPLYKIDGDFVCAAGTAFIPVPGTLLTFTVVNGGPVVFLLQCMFGGSGGEVNGQAGLRIDGVDQPLSARVIDTFAAGVGDFTIGQPQIWSLVMAPGAHTVQVLGRGVKVGEFGGGFASPLKIAANPKTPLMLQVIHN